MLMSNYVFINASGYFSLLQIDSRMYFVDRYYCVESTFSGRFWVVNSGLVSHTSIEVF